ncbi:hypothetical protein [Salinimicrobium xinjiangense]|uniref:hypothetical protein n=1 Tax=Salinimicrobium xinjiangense TaxID=438596 RepID=UPI0003FB6678|nr:hypothetical protein [Salinimicrobium xinjiangense]
MAAYVTQSEVNALWKSSLKLMIRECRTTKKVPEALVEIIKHNLYAKYVCYNAAMEHIEIGINESQQSAKTYPTIQVYSFPLTEIANRLTASYKSKRGDLEFYAKVFQGKRLDDRMSIL